MWLSSFNEPFSSILECQVLLTPKQPVINKLWGGLREGITQVQKMGQGYSPGPVNNFAGCWCNHVTTLCLKTRAMHFHRQTSKRETTCSLFVLSTILNKCLTCYLQKVAFLVCDSTCTVRVNVVLIIADALLLLGFTVTKCWYKHWKVK